MGVDKHTRNRSPAKPSRTRTKPSDIALAPDEQVEKSKKAKRPKRLAVVKGTVSRHYYSYMPNKRGHRVLVWVTFLVFSAMIAVQMLYPLDRTLPFARDDTGYVGWRERNILAATYQKQFQEAKVVLKSGTRTETRLLGQVGASVDTEAMVNGLAEYPFWQRLVPFSLFAVWPTTDHLLVEFDGKVAREQIDTLAQRLSYEPTNASVEIKDGAVVVGKAAPGNQVAVEQVRASLVQATYRAGTTVVTVPSETIQPTLHDKDVTTARQAAETALARDITIMITGRAEPIVPDITTRAQWLSITAADTVPQLAVNPEQIRAYVAELNDTVRIAPGVTTVQVVDGVERSQSGGKTGMALQIEAVTSDIVRALSGERDPVIRVDLHPVDPTIRFDRQYSHTQAGLQAYINFLTSTQNVRIAVEQLGGDRWVAAGREHESIPSASTYKLFVMMRVFDDINAGRITWDTPMLDTTAGGCFERTIVPSTNPCAEAWIRQYGHHTLTAYVHSRGFSQGTGFTFRDATHTTAADLARYLKGLYHGTLIDGANRDILLEKMGRQLYRGGIPAGTKGWAQNKVGFLWDYLHDAAIVHHPKGDYVLVIMSKGYGTYRYAANITRQIESIMYPE